MRMHSIRIAAIAVMTALAAAAPKPADAGVLDWVQSIWSKPAAPKGPAQPKPLPVPEQEVYKVHLAVDLGNGDGSGMKRAGSTMGICELRFGDPGRRRCDLRVPYSKEGISNLMVGELKVAVLASERAKGVYTVEVFAHGGDSYGRDRKSGEELEAEMRHPIAQVIVVRAGGGVVLYDRAAKGVSYPIAQIVRKWEKKTDKRFPEEVTEIGRVHVRFEPLYPAGAGKEKKP